MPAPTCNENKMTDKKGCMYAVDGTMVCGVKPLTYGDNIILQKSKEALSVNVEGTESCKTCPANGMSKAPIR